MERSRTSGGGRLAAMFGYVGRANAAPILARALDRLSDGGPKHVAVLVPDRSSESFHLTTGSPRRCHEWLTKHPSDFGTGVLCVAPAAPTNALTHNGLACRGHLSLAAVGSLATVRSRAAVGSGGGPVAEHVADLVEEHWIPPLHLSVSRALAGLRGAFQLIAMSTNEPGRVVCAGRRSTLCLGMREDGVVVCSDPDVVLADARGVAFLHGGEIGVVDADGWDLLAPDAMARLRRPVVDLTWYRAWARRKAQTMGPCWSPGAGSGRPELGEAQQAAQGLR